MTTVEIRDFLVSEPAKEILSMMLWETSPVAHCLRVSGQTIATKAEDEQAAALAWLLLIALEHGAGWRSEAVDRLKKLRDSLRETKS